MYKPDEQEARRRFDVEIRKDLASGRTDKAIKKLEQRLKQDYPKETQLLKHLASAYEKKGNKSKAAEACLRAADLFTEQGFYLKAVACLRQAIALPDEAHQKETVPMHLRLAALYVQLGLIEDAKSQYATVLKTLQSSLQAAVQNKEQDEKKVADLRRQIKEVKKNKAEIPQ